MNTTKKNKNVIIKDVLKSGNDIYRIQEWKNEQGTAYRDLRVFFKKDGKFKKTQEGLNILVPLCLEVATAIVTAKNAPELPEPAEGKKFESRLIVVITITETEQYQIFKVRGPKNGAVRIGYFFKGDNEQYFPNTKKAMSILDLAVDGVAEALCTPAPAVTEATETAAA